MYLSVLLAKHNEVIALDIYDITINKINNKQSPIHDDDKHVSSDFVYKDFQKGDEQRSSNKG